MGRQISWFGFTTRKQRRRREEHDRRQMFPFGEAQREAELALLRQLIELRGVRDNDLLYQLVEAKDCLVCQEDEDEEDRLQRLQQWLQSPLASRFPPRQLLCFLALAELEQGMEDLTALPDADAVRRRAEELRARWGEVLG